MKNSNKNISKKEISNVSKVDVKETKKEIDYSKMTMEQILSLDENELDDKIINMLLNSNKDVQSFTKNKTKAGNSKLYKDTAIKENESSKQFRNRIRKERNNLISSVNYFNSIENKVELKKSIKLFNTFYKETYSLNDYSLESLGRKNSDKDTLVNLKLALWIIKNNK